jgi:hypothetical protein
MDNSILNKIISKFSLGIDGKLLYNGQPIASGDIDDTIVSLVKTYSSSKIDTTYVKKEIGKSLFSGSYNDLTDKPQLGFTDLSTFTTDNLVESASKKYVSPTQITSWETHLTDNTNPHNTKISNLGDAQITTPVNNQILVYDVNFKMD